MEGTAGNTGELLSEGFGPFLFKYPVTFINAHKEVYVFLHRLINLA